MTTTGNIDTSDLESLDLSTPGDKVKLASIMLKNQYGTDGIIREGQPAAETLKKFSHVTVNDPILHFFNFQIQVALYHEAVARGEVHIGQ